MLKKTNDNKDQDENVDDWEDDADGNGSSKTQNLSRMTSKIKIMQMKNGKNRGDENIHGNLVCQPSKTMNAELKTTKPMKDNHQHHRDQKHKAKTTWKGRNIPAGSAISRS